jgi:RNA ligase
VFGYVRKDGMPKISTLVKPFYHKAYDGQIGFNYTPVAHNTLHAYPHGWTPVLRQCRGIVFHGPTGKLLAKPFPKFFNYGEHPESTDLPDGPVETTAKEDGHLAIIYRDHEGRITMTTRGSFKSSTGEIGRKMLRRIVKNKRWNRCFPRHCTLLAEMIHPATHVIRTYRGQPHFRVIGAVNNETLRELTYDELAGLAELALCVQVVQRRVFPSLAALRQHMKDRTVKNREGFVAMYIATDGRPIRVKFKYETYLGKMFAEKFSHGYAMRQMAAGKLEERLRMLPEEIVPMAKAMVAEISKVKRMKTPLKARWTYLYGLVPKEQQTSSYKATCRAFVKKVCG